MNLRFGGIVFLIATATWSCYRAPNDTIFAEDLDMVVTTYDEQINYGSAYSTYAICDSFSLISNEKDYTIDDANEPKFRNSIKAAIANNMDAYGYTLALATDTPDLYIPVTITYINTKGVAYYPIYSPGYGWGYPGYGYGYGYGGYYYSWGYVPTYFSYDQGSILVDLIDIKNRKAPIAPDTTWRVETVWNMGISGLATKDNPTERDKRIQQAINKGFEQSLYLKK